MNGVNALIKEAPREILCPFRHVRTQQEGCDPDVGPHGTVPVPSSWTSSLQTVRNKFLLRSHPVRGILLEQPEWAKTDCAFLLLVAGHQEKASREVVSPAVRPLCRWGLETCAAWASRAIIQS